VEKFEACTVPVEQVVRNYKEGKMIASYHLTQPKGVFAFLIANKDMLKGEMDQKKDLRVVAYRVMFE
jgi:hypothetical protein